MIADKNICISLTITNTPVVMDPVRRFIPKQLFSMAMMIAGKLPNFKTCSACDEAFSPISALDNMFSFALTSNTTRRAYPGYSPIR